MLDGWFESDPIKAVFGFDAIVGNYASPYDAGLGLCAAASRLRRGERQEGRLGPRHRRHGRDHPGDGEGCARAGVEIRSSGVREVIVESGRAVGVVTRMARSSARATSSPTSIRNCCIRGWCRRRAAGAISASAWRTGAAAPARSA